MNKGFGGFEISEYFFFGEGAGGGGGGLGIQNNLNYACTRAILHQSDCCGTTRVCPPRSSALQPSWLWSMGMFLFLEVKYMWSRDFLEFL